MPKPRISFIMPTYNRAYRIIEAIASIQAQTESNWELIVMDDGSTDDTRQVIAGLHDARIHYYYQENQGAAAARNNAWPHARADWVAYLDSDNELFPTYIATMFAWMERHPHGVFAIPRAHRTQELYENGKLIKCIDQSDDTPPGLTIKDIYMKKLHLDTNGFLHRRDLYDEGIRWDTALHGMEDWDFAMRIGDLHPDGFVYVEVVLYNYHQRYGTDGLVSNSAYGDWADVFEHIYQNHKDSPLLQGQSWHPAKVKKWRQLQADFEAGKLPPYCLYYFQDTPERVHLQV
jgi:glycosyltransferase involved in cell wall biosynthesis